VRRAAALGALLLIGLGLRLLILVSPLGELDADEALAGLMARHIAFAGERPAFFWGQSYLGTLEEFTAAALFVLFGAGTFVLKLAPMAYSLIFVALGGLTAHQLFGPRRGLATAAYLAFPPAMLGLWSIKARGGYAELLALGQALILATLWLARSPSPLRAGVWGLIAGLAFWTHLLAVVYLLPCSVYLLVVHARRWSLVEWAVLLAGGLVGAAPLIVFNVATDWSTFRDLLQPTDLPYNPLWHLVRFCREAIAVLVGIGAPVPPSDRTFNDRAFRAVAFGPAWAAGLACLAVGGIVVAHRQAVRAFLTRQRGREPEPALLLVVAATVVATITLTSYGYFVSEPRYALPLYACAPLLAGAVWRLPVPARIATGLGLATLHTRSFLLTVAVLFPADLVQSDAANRATLIQALDRRGVQHIHTDYWLANPLMFESHERILANTVAGLANRNPDLAAPVLADPNAIWLFQAGSDVERGFLTRVAALDSTPRVDSASIYHLYSDVSPAVLDAGLL